MSGVLPLSLLLLIWAPWSRNEVTIRGCLSAATIHSNDLSSFSYYTGWQALLLDRDSDTGCLHILDSSTGKKYKDSTPSSRS